MSGNGKLSAKERVEILTKRVAALRDGKGDHVRGNRYIALYSAADGLRMAQEDLEAGE